MKGRRDGRKNKKERGKKSIIRRVNIIFRNISGDEGEKKLINEKKIKGWIKDEEWCGEGKECMGEKIMNKLKKDYGWGGIFWERDRKCMEEMGRR